MRKIWNQYMKWAATVQYAFMWHFSLLVTGAPYHDMILFNIATSQNK